MAPSLRRAALLVLAVVLVTGCASLGAKLQSPHVSVLNVQMLTTDMFAQKFKVRLKVENPNDIELKVTGLEYEILLMGDGFAEGNSSDRFLLPAKGEAEFDMNVSTNFVSSLGRLISRMNGGKLENIDYEIVGQVFVDKGMLKKIPFSDKGKVDFNKARRD
ncbi:MAG TPA: LEA type 2 family protein [Steroidobacteraceae bacterium]